MLADDIEKVNLFFGLIDGKHDGRDAWCRIKTVLAEIGTAPNTDSPKLRQFIADLEDLRTDLQVDADNVDAVLAQLRAGA
jgi:hypothetical protein